MDHRCCCCKQAAVLCCKRRSSPHRPPARRREILWAGRVGVIRTTGIFLSCIVDFFFAGSNRWGHSNRTVREAADSSLGSPGRRLAWANNLCVVKPSAILPIILTENNKRDSYYGAIRPIAPGLLPNRIPPSR